MRHLLAGATLLALCAAAPPSARASTPAGEITEPAELTAEQWREDLRFMVAEMQRRHRNLHHTVSRDAFAAAVADLDARIPSLQRNEIIVELMRLAAMVGDGHTRVDPRKDPKFGFPSMPLKLYLFEDGLFIRAAAPGHAELAGAKVEGFGDVPTEEALRRVAQISSRDNAIGPKLFAPLYLNMPDVLHALKLSDSRRSAELRLSKGGRAWTAQVPAGDVEPLWPPDTDISLVTPDGWIDARSTAGPPLWLQAPLDYHRLVELPDQNAIYVQLNMVAGVKGQTLAQFADRIGERIAAENPRAVVLDVRLNHGGDGNLRTPLVRQLIRAEDADTRLFVLTWRGAFSATQFILDDLDRLTEAVFIGEPASSKPSSYGDAYRMPLPNSGISVRSSIVWWQSGQDFSPWTPIDVATPYRFADYATGRDPALEAALAFTPQPSLTERLIRAADTGGASAVAAEIESRRLDPSLRYADLGRDLVVAVQGLAASGRREMAFAAAELTARLAPASADAALVLGFLAEHAGHRDVAINAGRRTLELDPNNRQARSLLERLEPSGAP